MLRIAKSGFLSGLNNIMVPLHQESRFTLYVDKFGFTSDEVKILLSMHEGLQIKGIQKWYIAGGIIVIPP